MVGLLKSHMVGPSVEEITILSIDIDSFSTVLNRQEHLTHREDCLEVFLGFHPPTKHMMKTILLADLAKMPRVVYSRMIPGRVWLPAALHIYKGTADSRKPSFSRGNSDREVTFCPRVPLAVPPCHGLTASVCMAALAFKILLRDIDRKRWPSQGNTRRTTFPLSETQSIVRVLLSEVCGCNQAVRLENRAGRPELRARQGAAAGREHPSQPWLSSCSLPTFRSLRIFIPLSALLGSRPTVSSAWVSGAASDAPGATSGAVLLFGKLLL